MSLTATIWMNVNVVEGRKAPSDLCIYLILDLIAILKIIFEKKKKYMNIINI